MGTIDNIYIISYLINRQLAKKGGRMAAFFVDLKTAFDLVDKGVLVKTIRERKIRAELVRRVEKALRETKSRVGVEDVAGEQFWTA